MGKIMKPGKVVIVLGGRYAGRKGIIIKNYDDGSNERHYGHALVVGIDKYPLKVTKNMGKKRVKKRTRIKSFVKVLNYNHIMPTRYTVDIPFDKQVVNKEGLRDLKGRRRARFMIKKKLEERHKTGKNRWFFQKLRF
ncbi:PREDICTED: 60S ribosomal protein L27-like [Amphimedon queenslandica]|uniref:60S ribosomal protein L27 n=1 Tax=Amphimedon queenslandica TaxID=400682 RepID=I1FX35_AMPQE|nr:PREDICTED: 60S ribosomal protein L27-like [Amphimedon queenslandica]|eukprot:XP_003386102.1 PREDICTED: 60S ribosomal protein L27-like [Amphimedon queenslandica]